MKPITKSEFKSHFSEVIAKVKAGVSFIITDGKEKEIIGYFISESSLLKPKRKLGLLEGKAIVKFKPGFKISEQNLLG